MLKIRNRNKIKSVKLTRIDRFKNQKAKELKEYKK